MELNIWHDEDRKDFSEIIRQDKSTHYFNRSKSWRRHYELSSAFSLHERVPNYRDSTPQDEWDLLERGLNRVTDMHPEHEASCRLQKKYIFKNKYGIIKNVIPTSMYKKCFIRCSWRILWNWLKRQLDVCCSWEKFIIVPGREDSTMGNIFALCYQRRIKAPTMKSIEYMTFSCWLVSQNSKV
jgi:deoxyhypusine synthase